MHSHRREENGKTNTHMVIWQKGGHAHLNDLFNGWCFFFSTWLLIVKDQYPVQRLAIFEHNTYR